MTPLTFLRASNKTHTAQSLTAANHLRYLQHLVVGASSAPVLSVVVMTVSRISASYAQGECLLILYQIDRQLLVLLRLDFHNINSLGVALVIYPSDSLLCYTNITAPNIIERHVPSRSCHIALCACPTRKRCEYYHPRRHRWSKCSTSLQPKYRHRCYW